LEEFADVLFNKYGLGFNNCQISMAEKIVFEFVRLKPNGIVNQVFTSLVIEGDKTVAE